MKKVQDCKVENCIPTPSSCTEWNGGSIEYLGICDGDSLNDLTLEIVSKLKAIAGEDLSQFDIDSLLDVCNQKAPTEVTLLSILNTIKNNQICLKDFIDVLDGKLSSLFQNSSISVNLKCYAEFDNIGNSLSITREQLDQLIIDNLCSQKTRIDTLEGKVVNLQSEIDNISLSTTVDELTFATCVNSNILPTSTQVINTSAAHCALQTSTGTPGNISSALAKTPGDLNAEFGTITGWIAVPSNWAENYNNLILEIENLRQRVITMESTCCALTCDDIKLGFTAVFSDDGDTIVIKFSFGAGTVIPAGVTDKGSTGTLTDKDGNIESFNLTIANNAEIDVPISGLNTNGEIIVNISAKMGTSSLTCEKCLSKTIMTGNCAYCKICNTGVTGEVIVVYDDNGGARAYNSFNPTTTTSTTTVGP